MKHCRSWRIRSTNFQTKNKCIIEAQQFVSALHRHFWQYAVICCAFLNHIKMAQKIITPEIKNCYCGANAKILTWDIYGENIYQVMCENRHTLSKYCATRHRAICRWNNRVSQHSI